MTFGEMKMINEIKSQIEDLLAYYPGRGTPALVWLVIIPVLAFILFYVVFGRVLDLPSDGIPSYMTHMAGNSFTLVYNIAAFVMLLRVCHSSRTKWRETVTIMSSSVGYGLLIGIPFVIFNFVWLASHIGTSIVGFAQVLSGLFLSIGGLILLVAVLGIMAYRLGLIIPLLLIGTRIYQYLLPVVYPAEMVPSHWRIFHTFAIPLSPTTTILRHGLLNDGWAAGSFWMAAVLHAMIGYGLAFWIWKQHTEQPPTVSPPEGVPSASKP